MKNLPEEVQIAFKEAQYQIGQQRAGKIKMLLLIQNIGYATTHCMFGLSMKKTIQHDIWRVQCQNK